MQFTWKDVVCPGETDVEPHAKVQYSIIVAGLITTTPPADASAIGGPIKFNMRSAIMYMEAKPITIPPYFHSLYPKPTPLVLVGDFIISCLNLRAF
jgi:hypothetical protein